MITTYRPSRRDGRCLWTSIVPDHLQQAAAGLRRAPLLSIVLSHDYYLSTPTALQEVLMDVYCSTPAAASSCRLMSCTLPGIVLSLDHFLRTTAAGQQTLMDVYNPRLAAASGCRLMSRVSSYHRGISWLLLTYNRGGSADIDGRLHFEASCNKQVQTYIVHLFLSLS